MSENRERQGNEENRRGHRTEKRQRGKYKEERQRERGREREVEGDTDSGEDTQGRESSGHRRKKTEVIDR